MILYIVYHEYHPKKQWKLNEIEPPVLFGECFLLEHTKCDHASRMHVYSYDIKTAQ